MMMMKTINDEVTGMFGPVDWVHPNMGYMICPGEEYHSSPSKHKDCAIYLDKVPTIFCLHNSCKAEVKGANVRLRAGLDDGSWSPSKLTKEQRARIKHRKSLEAKERRLAANAEGVLQDYSWPVSEIIDASPTPVLDEWSQFLGLFDDDDILWCGETHHTGAPKYKSNFKPVSEWKLLLEPPYHFICGSTFKPDTHSRSKDFVQRHVSAVVEIDTLHIVPEINKDLSGAVFRYIQEIYGWKLRCIIDSGNRSLHAHFDHPGDEQMLFANVVLPALNVDTSTLRSVQPARACGINRDNGNPQRLLWIR